MPELHQMARVIAGRIGKYGFAAALFDDFAVFQYHHAVRQGADDGEVVADDDEAEAVFFLQIGEQLQNLLLPLYVERAGRFVQNEDFRADDDGAGDGEPLALSAGKSVRIAFERVFGQSDLPQYVLDALPHFCAG